MISTIWFRMECRPHSASVVALLLIAALSIAPALLLASGCGNKEPKPTSSGYYSGPIQPKATAPKASQPKAD